MQLRKEGLDGHEKMKSYIWWLSFLFAIVEGIVVACTSLQYSVFAATAQVKSSICSIKSQEISQIGCPYLLGVLGIFTVVTMFAVVVTEGCRKIKLQYYGFKLASASREGSPITEVEPYIPFNINPAGMQPVLTITYLLAFPSILASIVGSPFLLHVKEIILNPESTVGAPPWVYYSVYAFFVFLFNIFDIANLPKEIAEYLNKMGARIPNIKPGKATIEYLTKIQASTRFWGGLLLSFLATSSSVLDHYLRSINQGFSIGFTLVLIIVGSIIELRRSYHAYNVMPSLSKALKRLGKMIYIIKVQNTHYHHCFPKEMMD
ncbi:hypothetical protein Rs2_26000 [Raphanus sativus]|nr:hypothetical protein Rs2_26000 [Raphanus sativus]